MNEKQPKRRKDKLNPYMLSKKGHHYFIFFKDGEGSPHYYEIDKPLYDLFNSFELEDLSHLNEVDRHVEQFELTEETLNKRAFSKQAPIDETVIQAIQRDLLHKAIKSLSEKQRRRLYLYYFKELTYERIAEMEGCTKMPIKRSIDKAIVEIRKKFFS